MRLVITVILGLLFTVAVCAATLAYGLVRTASDGGAVIAAADTAGVRAAIVQDNLAVERIVSREWFDQTVLRLHRTAVAAVAAAPATATLDLRPLKADLRHALDDLAERARPVCAGCDWSRGAAAIDRIDDRIDVAALVTPDPSQRAAIREWARRLVWLPAATVAVVAGLFLLIVLVNLGRTRRVLAAAGGTLLAAAVVSLAAHVILAGRLDTAIQESRLWTRDDAGLGLFASPIAAKLASAMVEAAAATTRGWLLAAGLVGLVLAAVAATLRRPPST